MNGIVSVYAVFADAGEAERIGRAMVERRLAACVNILGPCRSVYRWRGAIAEADEVAAIFKASAEGAQALVDAIVVAHSYEVPAVVVWPIATTPGPYSEWVREE